MPITPRFTISQTESHVLLDIRVPHVRVSTESIQVALSTSETESASAPSILDLDDGGNQSIATETLTTLHFSSSPYLLVLNFAPNKFHEAAAEACATYEPIIENGIIRLTLRKLENGSWHNLDLIGRMVQPKTKFSESLPSTTNWLQEVTEGTQEDNDHDNDDNDGNNDVTVSESNPSLLQVSGQYGFRRMFYGIFVDLQRDGLAREMLELPWEEEAPNDASHVVSDGDDSERGNMFWRRRQLRWRQEKAKFDKDRWLQDLDIEEDYVYQCALAMECHWQCGSQSTTAAAAAAAVAKTPEEQSHSVESITADIESLSMNASESMDTTRESYFSEDERLQLHSIPYPLLPQTPTDQDNPSEAEALLLGLWDILFAYVYDHLTTDGESTVESAWTVTTLSSLFSCLEDYADVVALDGRTEADRSATSLAVSSSIRRSLIYPYLRNISFATHCAKQVTAIFQQGPRCIIRCLLQTRKVLEQSELYYLGNKLFVDPYLAWLQKDINHVQMAIQRWTPKVEQVVATERRTLEDLDLNVSDSSSDEESDDSDVESDSDSETDSEDDEDHDHDASANSPRRVGEEKSGSGRNQVSSALLDHNIGTSTTPGLLQSITSPGTTD